MSGSWKALHSDGEAPQVKVCRAGRTSSRWGGAIMASVYVDEQGNVVLANWLEAAGTGDTERAIYLSEEHEALLGELLAKRAADRARKVLAAKAEEESAAAAKRLRAALGYPFDDIPEFHVDTPESESA